MRAVVLSGTLLGCALACTPVRAQQESASPLPTYEVGQTFVFDNGRVERVKHVGEERIEWVTRRGRTYERLPNPVVPVVAWSSGSETATRRIYGDPDRLWPLAPGRTARFRVVTEITGPNGRQRRATHLWACRVRAAQRVETGAGPFVAWPLECDRYSAATMRVLERTTLHWSAAVGHYVRRESRNLRTGGRTAYALYAALPPRRASAARVDALLDEILAGKPRE